MESLGKTSITQSLLLAGELMVKMDKSIGLLETLMDPPGVTMESSLLPEVTTILPWSLRLPHTTQCCAAKLDAEKQ
jgi:hypothetical protein